LQPCTVRLPCCNGDPDTTVFAHAPSISKGVGQKSPDWWGAFACSSCHDVLDSRTPHHYPEALILDTWLKAIHETLRIQFKDGLLRES
jgi:hypothetical protein